MHIQQLMQQSGVGFGTSGARGTVEAMTNPVCHAYTLGFIQALRADGSLQAGATVFLAGDLRPSTPRILAAVARALRDAGCRPRYCGRLPSPAIAFHAMQQGCASIMVTGSHIPDDRNGIKFNRPEGEILKSDEARIREQRVQQPEPFPDIGPQDLPPEDPAAREAYRARYTGFFSPDALAGLKLGVYQHSGVARELLPEILTALGAEVTPLARSEHFIPVDTEAIRPEDIELARRWAREYGFDAIVSTDGDADRPLLADERGEWLRGDVLGVLCARALGIRELVTPVSSNSLVEACGAFARVHRTRIGSPYVIEAMQQALAEGAVPVAGYEANGGFLLASALERGGRRLAALPTRDAVLPLVAVLAEARTRAMPLSRLIEDLPPRFTASDRLKDFPTDIAHRRIAELAASPAAIEAMFGQLCGRLAATDPTDGLRMRFANDEIIHLRPSGNAPELRCYNEAASPTRARELNQACLQRLAAWRA
ncbi:MAG TPA: phosphomannomutase [Gammaproteobacteria bacterium]|nr:phosphomannomutase [Gammaproteobacteria bacterium]